VVSKDDFLDFAALEAATRFDADGALITGADGSIMLAGVDESELNEHQFLFV
jgi:hypothetical protein